jgi:hypothetical protein
MITIAICLIYYGIAVWLYQMYLWVSTGKWVSITVLTAWKIVFGTPEADRSMLGTLAQWFLNWPLSLSLLALGAGVLLVFVAWRAGDRAYRHRLRRKWAAEQCEQAGYTSWDVPKVLADLEASSTLNQDGRKQRFGHR